MNLLQQSPEEILASGDAEITATILEEVQTEDVAAEEMISLDDGRNRTDTNGSFDSSELTCPNELPDDLEVVESGSRSGDSDVGGIETGASDSLPV